MSAQAQPLTFQINTKTVIVMMTALVLAIPATLLLTLLLLVPRMAQADNTQTGNANPVYQLPPGYAVAPATCVKADGSTAAASTSPAVAYAAIAPYGNYSSVMNQSQTETNTTNTNTSTAITTNTDSFNVRGDVRGDTFTDSNNGNGSNIGNDSSTTNTSSTTVVTTSTTDSNNTTTDSNNSNSVVDSTDSNVTRTNDSVGTVVTNNN